MRRWAMLCAFALLLFALLFALAAWIKNYQLASEVSLPLLAIAGVMALLGSLAVVAIGFSMMNLSDRTQALGLPNGSVRAVIALCLVVLFAILSVYLFGALHDQGRTRLATCLAAERLDAFRRNLPLSQVVAVVPSSVDELGHPCTSAPKSDSASRSPSQENGRPATSPGSAPKTGATAPDNVQIQPPQIGEAPPAAGSGPGPRPAEAPAPETSGSPALFTIFFQDNRNSASEDFAKQLLVLIGTLVTSVCGFYFGSKATSDARGAPGEEGPPVIASVEPSKFDPRGKQPTEIRIVGSHLNAIRQAKLVSGDTSLTDGSVVSNSGEVLARFGFSQTVPEASYDVVVVDALGRQARLAGAFTISRENPKTLALTSVEPTSIPRDVETTLKITGVELDRVNAATLSAGGATIAAKSVQAESAQIIAVFKIPAASIPGHWDLNVTDAAGTAGALADAIVVT